MASFKVQTKGFNDIIDITDKTEKIVEDSGVDNGIAMIFVVGSTAGITTIEYEKGVVEDLKEIFEKIAPVKGNYYHEEAWHDGNGFSHVRAAILKPSLTVPIESGKLLLGTWQQVVLVDFDNKPRERKVVVKVV
jgi:secondary thiamine-phosphate synthase enzyme